MSEPDRCNCCFCVISASWEVCPTCGALNPDWVPPAAPDWQDISTAPRDGTIVLLREGRWIMSGFLKLSKQYGTWHWHVICRPSGNYSSAIGMSFHPNEWAPIPAPPKEVG